MQPRVRMSPLAWQQFETLLPGQQVQARRLIAAVLSGGPATGRPWVRDNKQRQQWIVSASDTHIIYRFSFVKRQDTLYITAVLVFPTPPDPNNRDEPDQIK